jgi:DNA-binding MarR family transcriptional regulator
MTHPTKGLSNVVHQRVRLGILTVLRQVARADFSYLRDRLELTDGNLSRNLAVLEESGYVTIEKTFEGKRPRTWVTITKAGTRALAEEVESLRRLLDELDGDEPSTRPPRSGRARSR